MYCGLSIMKTMTMGMTMRRRMRATTVKRATFCLLESVSCLLSIWCMPSSIPIVQPAMCAPQSTLLTTKTGRRLMASTAKQRRQRKRRFGRMSLSSRYSQRKTTLHPSTAQSRQLEVVDTEVGAITHDRKWALTVDSSRSSVNALIPYLHSMKYPYNCILSTFRRNWAMLLWKKLLTNTLHNCSWYRRRGKYLFCNQNREQFQVQSFCVLVQLYTSSTANTTHNTMLRTKVMERQAKRGNIMVCRGDFVPTNQQGWLRTQSSSSPTVAYYPILILFLDSSPSLELYSSLRTVCSSFKSCLLYSALGATLTNCGSATVTLLSETRCLNTRFFLLGPSITTIYRISDGVGYIQMHTIDALALSYESELTLKSLQTHKFMGYSSEKQVVTAQSPPHWSSASEVPCAIALRVSPVEKGSATNLTDGVKVYLRHGDNYLLSTGKGEVRFDCKSSSEEMNKVLLRSAAWVVQLRDRSLAEAGTTRITVYSEVCIKAPSAWFLIAGKDGTCATAEESAQGWQLWPANTPQLPQWMLAKSGFARSMRGTPSHRPPKPTSTSLQVQEATLVEDLLDALLGFESGWIRRRNGGLVVEEGLGLAQCQLGSKVLTLQYHYEVVEGYIWRQGVGEGTVCQAVCGALRVLIKEYKMMVVQLDEQADKGKLTLQMLWYYVQKVLKVMEGLALLVREAGSLRGGQLLTCILKLMNESSDAQVAEIYGFLFRKAATVYMQIVGKWIYEGVVEDKHSEFMVEATDSPQWDVRFRLRLPQIPSFLQKNAETILLTGKYLNVLRQCKKELQHPYRQRLESSLDLLLRVQDFTQPLLQSYDWVNLQIKALMEEYRLTDVLRSLKGYFFMEYGDLFVHFMESAEEDLAMPRRRNDSRSKQFSLEKIENLFEVVIRTSSASGDPFKDDVSCRMEHTSVHEQMQRVKSGEEGALGVEAGERPYFKKEDKYVDFLTLDFKCEFPINLIVDKRSLAKYQVIFRFLFWSKWVERELNSTWLALQATKEIGQQRCRGAFLLCQRMLHYLRNYIYYFCYEVLEQNYVLLQEALRKASNLQDLRSAHTRFLNTCLNESLLTHPRLLPLLTDAAVACQGFFPIRRYLLFIHDEKLKMHLEKHPPSPNAYQLRNRLLANFKELVAELFQEDQFNKVVASYAVLFEQALAKLLRELQTALTKHESAHYLGRLLEALDHHRPRRPL